MRHTPQRDAQASRESAATSPATNLRRRRFLLALSAGTAGSAAAVAQAVVPATPAPAETSAEQGRGYQETQHVRDYYASARI